MMPIDKIIVLAAESFESDSQFANFHDGMYLGGQVRFEAAAKIATEFPSVEMVLVGGYNRPGQGDSSISDKVDAMMRFIGERAPQAWLSPVYSLPCTYHNFVAVFDSWQRQTEEISRVGILSNSFHLPRAQAWAERVAKAAYPDRSVTFVLMSAEEILEVDIKSIVGNRQDEYAARLSSEARGLRQIREGTYQDSCLHSNFSI